MRSLLQSQIFRRQTAKLQRLSAKLAAKLVHRVQEEALTDRETQILELLAKGLSNRSIGVALHISESTLRNHLTVIYKKFGVSNRHGLLGYVLQHGLLLPA